MDLETWFQIHTKVSNFETVSPNTIKILKKLPIFVTPVNSCQGPYCNSGCYSTTKLGQLTNIKVVNLYKLDKICNLTQSPAQPQSSMWDGWQVNTSMRKLCKLHGNLDLGVWVGCDTVKCNILRCWGHERMKSTVCESLNSLDQPIRSAENNS